MSQAEVTVLGAVVGFLGKSAWDLFWKQWHERQSLQYRKRLEVLEQQLSRFYWPVYIRLQKDNVVWQRILDRSKGIEDLLARIGEEIESKVVIPNHQETVRIIQDNIHLALADKELETLLLQYIRHVAVYAAMRDTGCKDMDPIMVGEPWPEKLFPVVAEHTLRLQAEFNRLTGRVTAVPPSGTCSEGE